MDADICDIDVDENLNLLISASHSDIEGPHPAAPGFYWLSCRVERHPDGFMDCSMSASCRSLGYEHRGKLLHKGPIRADHHFSS